MSKLTIVAFVAVCFVGQASAITVGFTENFVGNTIPPGWISGASLSNPGTDGVDGAGDGYLNILRSAPGNLGAANTLDFAGDYTAAGVGSITFWLRDVGAVQSPAFNIHVVIGTGTGSANPTNIWLLTTNLVPNPNGWTTFTIGFNAADWQRVAGASSFASCLTTVERFLIRADAATGPWSQNPPNFAGEFGVDKITVNGVVPEPATLLVLGGLAAAAALRRRRR